MLYASARRKPPGRSRSSGAWSSSLTVCWYADNTLPIIAADICDAALYERLDRPTAVMLTANPGLRRGHDNGLEHIITDLTGKRYPQARFIYTGSTAVYADRGGAGCDEMAPVADHDSAVAGLLAVEQAMLVHQEALVLRATALVGPSRTHALERLKRGETVVRSIMDGPFSYLHKAVVAELCVRGALGRLGCGLLNAAAPERLTVRKLFELLAKRAGLTVSITSDDSVVPSRWINAHAYTR